VDIDAGFAPCLVHQRMLKTGHGLIGLAPAGTQAGDLLVFCKDGKLPLMVRPSGRPRESKTWRLIGDGYVHGTIDSRLWAHV